jgi:hypothetical protein
MPQKLLIILFFLFVFKLKGPSLIISVRFLTSITIFFGYCIQYMLKINMSIAIVCMVNNTALRELASAEKNLTVKKNTPDESECAASVAHGKATVSSSPF